jgi:hypothetical protein
MISAFGVDHGSVIAKAALYNNYAEGVKRRWDKNIEGGINEIKTKKYKPAGNNVYARERKLLGRKNSKLYVKQTVADNKGSDNKLYVKTGYKGLATGKGGETYSSNRKKVARIDAYPGLRHNAKNRIKTKYVATHEHEHSKEAGTSHRSKTVSNARSYGNAKTKKSKNKFVNALKDPNRMYEFNQKMVRNRAKEEGLADAAATKKHKIPAWKVSGYPGRAQIDSLNFGRGYREGGGQLPSRGAQKLKDNKAWNSALQQEQRAMKQEKGNK